MCVRACVCVCACVCLCVFAIGFDLVCVLFTGLKVPTVINHNTAKAAAANQTAAKTAPAANQSLTKQTSQNHLQRSGSARLSRLNTSRVCVCVGMGVCVCVLSDPDGY